MFPDRYPVTDRSRVSNIPVPIRTTRHGFWAARGLLLPGNPLRLPTVWCSGIVKFKDKVKNGGSGELPCLWVFEIIWCVLFLVCDSEHTLINLENIKFLVSYSLYYIPPPVKNFVRPRTMWGGGVNSLKHLNKILISSCSSFCLRMYLSCAVPILEKYRYSVFDSMSTGTSLILHHHFNINSK